MQNAIKHSNNNSNITVEIYIKPLPLQQNTFTKLISYLFTKIIDEGKGIDLKKWGANGFKSFNFIGSGANQESETSGVGVGLSTAGSLTKALGG
jgi:K+-sensing histidine kinase KdpD